MQDIEQNYARVFGTPSGRAVLQHMRHITLERTLGPNATDAQLRWLESQRSFVHQIENLITRGQHHEV